MKEKFKVLIAGGDMRQIYCANRLASEADVYITGFDDGVIPDDIELEKADLNSRDFFDCAVLPVPPLSDIKTISTPCSKTVLLPSEIIGSLKKGAVIFAGRTDERLKSIFSGFEVCDYMKREELSLKNAIPTAEGAVQIALEELPVTINRIKVLIVGTGRIGTCLAEILKGFGADITFAVHNARGSAKAKMLGVRSVCSSSMGTDFQLVFNTVPDLIFDRELLSRFDTHTLFIDLASKPGGIDFDSASQLGIKAVWALGLPGKTAPVTAGEFIAETISCILSERGDCNG